MERLSDLSRVLFKVFLLEFLDKEDLTSSFLGMNKDISDKQYLDFKTEVLSLLAGFSVGLRVDLSC